MDQRGYLAIGLKLIGVYSGAILGIPSLVSAFSSLVAGWPPRIASGTVVYLLLAKLLAFLTPAVYLCIAYFLIKRSGKCVEWCMAGEDRPGHNQQ